MKCVDIFSRRFMTDRQQEENGNNGGKRDHPEHLRAEEACSSGRINNASALPIPESARLKPTPVARMAVG